MNKYNNPRLLNAVVSGTGMKHPIQPHVVVGDVSNGFIRGDLMDANAIVDLVNSGDAIDQETIRQAVAEVIGTAPENLDTLGEVAETLTDMQDATKQGSLAYKIAAIESELDETSPTSTIGEIKENIQNIISGLDSFSQAVDRRFTTVETSLQNMQQTIEDNELTIAAALNDLNSRVTELEPDEDKIPVFMYYQQAVAPPYQAPAAFPGYIKDNELVIYATQWYCTAPTNIEVHKGQFPQHYIFPIICDTQGNTLYSSNGPMIYDSQESLDANIINTYFRSVYAEVVRRFPNVNNMSIELVDTPFEPKAKLPNFESYVTIPYMPNESGREYNINLTVEISSSAQEFNFVSSRYNVLALEVDGVQVSPATYVTDLASGLHTINAVVVDNGSGGNGRYPAPYPCNTTYASQTKSFDIARGANMIEQFSSFNGTSITIPDTVQFIKNSAFASCPNLKEVIIEGESSVTSLSSNGMATGGVSDADSVFQDCPSLESIYVKDHLVSWYKIKSCWRNYAEYIKPISEYYETH